MKTVDVHVHLLNSSVSFDRFYDKIALYFFAKRFGIHAKDVLKEPYKAYTDALIRNVEMSQHIDKIVLFGVDAVVDEQGNILHQDKTVCASNEDVARLYQQHPDKIIPFFSINPKRPDAVELIKKYYAMGFKGAKLLQNYWGVDLNDKCYKSYFETLASLNLPTIIHIGSENSIHSHKAYESIDMLQQPLELGVKVICAHMALSYENGQFFKALRKDPKHYNEEYFKLLEMLTQYDNLYAIFQRF